MQAKGRLTVLVTAFGLLLVGGNASAQFAGEDFEVWVGEERLLSVADGQAQARRAAALREPAYLFVEAASPDAEILLQSNLEFKGRAFLKIRDTRLVRVTVRTPGVGTVDGFLELSEREVVKFKVGYTRPATGPGGLVTVISNPNGAEVYLDGVNVGQTPLTLRKVAPGLRQVAMSFGSWTWQSQVDVRAGQNELIEVPVGAVAMAAPAPAPAPRTAVPARQATPVVAPAPAPAPAPVVVAPAPAPDPAPAPQPTRAAVEKGKAKPKCNDVCDKFIQAVDSAGLRGPIRDLCMRRCDAGDLDFSVCAWKARSMADVQACGAMPESP